MPMRSTKARSQSHDMKIHNVNKILAIVYFDKKNTTNNHISNFRSKIIVTNSKNVSL